MPERATASFSAILMAARKHLRCDMSSSIVTDVMKFTQSISLALERIRKNSHRTSEKRTGWIAI